MLSERKLKKQTVNMNILTEPQIPLPKLDSVLREKIDKQLGNKVNLHKYLPTVGQISLFNTYKQVNCVCISDSGAVMAAGLSNSVVKVFVLSKKLQDVLTIEDVI